MFLTVKNLYFFLLDKGLIDPSSIVDGNYAVTQLVTRNTIFKVKVKDAKSLFIKQLVSTEPQSTYVLQKDATCLWIIKNENRFKKLSVYVPEYLGFDAERQILITEYLEDAKNLFELSLERGKFSDDFAPTLATILASYHFDMDEAMKDNQSIRFFTKELPWVFNLAELSPTQTRTYLSFTQAPNPAITYIFQTKDLRDFIAGLKYRWEPHCLIHGDLKWLNIMAQKTGNDIKLKLIDWEIADIGDPAWDVAGIFHSFNNERMLKKKKDNNLLYAVPEVNLSALKKVLPALKAFWIPYRKKAGLTPKPGKAFLKKAIDFTALRTMQTAIEYNMHFAQVQPDTLRLLSSAQLIFNNQKFIRKKLNDD